jgi:hypothetical protein
MTAADATVDRFLAAYPPAIQDLAWQARALVLASLRSLPQTDEVVDTSARLLGYGCGKGYAGMVCVLIPSRTEVKLGFYRGADLADPNHLLEGSGKVHRHVRLRAATDLKRPGLKALLRAAQTAWKRRNAARTPR